MSLLTQAPPSPIELSKQIDAKRLRATIEKLASWNDRNTNNPTLTEAAKWIADQYRQIPGLEVEIMTYRLPKMARVPEEKDVVQVIATLKGETDRRVIVGGHFDTINMVDRENGLKSRAPGANDDASGTSLALELARVMSQRKWKNTLVFVAFSGEEQGLYGSKALAERAVKEDWKIDAVLSNDIVGSSSNKAGQKDDKHIRMFSADPASVVAGEQAPARVQHSRELARLIEFVTRGTIPGFAPMPVFRNDRFGRGGDHTPFWQAGFSSVRFTEPHEEYSRQHTPDDLPEFVDFKFLANVARVNLIAMGNLGDADETPTRVTVDRAQGHDTTLHWRGKPGVSYVVYWRESTAPFWQGSEVVTGETFHSKLSKDDYFFAVGAKGGIPVEAR